jgi:hypothetical protein
MNRELKISLDELMAHASDEVFSFFADNRGYDEGYHFNTTKMRAFIDDNILFYPSVAKAQMVQITRETYEHILSNNGIELEKLDRLYAVPNKIYEPVLLADMGFYNGKQWHVMIDGNHRTVLKYRMGQREQMAYLIPKSTWERFLAPFPTDREFMTAIGTVK